MPVVWIPPLLRGLTGGVEKVAVSGTNLRQVINNVVDVYPALQERLLYDESNIQAGVAVAIDGETNHMGLLEPVGSDSEIHFIPAIGGG